MTARELIERAYEWTGLIGEGEPMTNEQATLGLKRLNDWIDQLTTERRAIGSVTRTTFSTVASQAAYTIAGVPSFIDAVALILDSNESPLLLLDDAGYAAIPDKATAGQPTHAYYNRTPTTGTLTLWPVPGTTYSAVLYVPAALAEIVALTTTLVIQPGYRRFFITGLAEELCAAHGVDAPPQLTVAANDSRLALQNANKAPLRRICTTDAGMPGNRNRTWYDYRTGPFR